MTQKRFTHRVYAAEVNAVSVSAAVIKGRELFADSSRCDVLHFFAGFCSVLSVMPLRTAGVVTQGMTATIPARSAESLF